jgi:hypothetical protein
MPMARRRDRARASGGGQQRREMAMDLATLRVGTAEMSLRETHYLKAPIKITSRLCRAINTVRARARYQCGVDGAASNHPKVLAGPPCEACGGTTRIVRIEPHPRFKRRHVWVLECMVCGESYAADMPAPSRTH